MIVRCNNCVSAFAVDDEKVANKKFAFTCPKCSTENIIDNRVIGNEPKETELQFEDSFDDDFSTAPESPAQSKKQISTPEPQEDDLFFDEEPAENSVKSDSIEDELASDYPAGEITAETGKKERNINLEIEESADFPEFEDEISTGKTQAVKKELEDDLLADIPAFEDEFISFDETETAKPSADKFDIELKNDSAKIEEENIFTDDFDESPEKPVKKKETAENDLNIEDTDFDFEDIDTVTAPDDAAVERDKKLSSQDDIDALFAEEGIEFDEKPISKQSEKDLEDEITVDLDMLDIEFEESGDEKPGKAVPMSAKSESEAPFADDITLDIDNLDIELDETSLGADIFDEPVKTGKSREKASAADEDITLDIDNLDIDLDETSLDPDLFETPVKKNKQKPDDSLPEEDITLDIDTLDIDLDESSLGSEIFEEPVAPAAKKQKPAAADDDITLDIDNLDIDLDESSLNSEIFEEPVTPAAKKQKPAAADDDITLDIDNLDIDLEETSLDNDIFNEPVPVKSSAGSGKKLPPPEIEDDFNEEDIKLNLDDLDIDLEEIEERELIFEDDIIETPSPVTRQKAKPLPVDDDEDESITIDLDTLELEIADEKNTLGAELSEEDEKLTLDDAGLTFDELTTENEKTKFEEHDDEDIKLTLDEIDPDLTLEKIAQSGSVETEHFTDSLEELPEIDLDEYDAIVRQESRAAGEESHELDDDFIIFPESDVEITESPKRDYDIFDYDESDFEKSSPEKGSTYFSIDFSLKYSRIGALLRLLGLYGLSMIPHFVVMFLYTILSSIVGFINQIVILSTGRCVEDFALVIENTMRYFFYIKTNIIGIVEDRPVYAGREYIDHPLQLDITYPVKYSKNLAILRLSIIGIFLITLPHLLITVLLTVTIPVVYLAGILSVIITRRWPNLLFIYLTKYFRYLAGISSFMTGLTDEYPSFKFD